MSLKIKQNYILFSILCLIAAPYFLYDDISRVFYILFSASLILCFKISLLVEITRKKETLTIAFLVVYLATSSFWSNDPGEYFFKMLKHGAYILIANIVFYCYFRKEENPDEKILLILKCTAFFGFLAGMLTLLFNLEGIFLSYISNERLTHYSLLGRTENPIHTGFFFGVSALFCLFLYKTEVSRKKSWLYLISLIFLGSLLVLTKSRGAMLFFAISSLLCLILIPAVNPERNRVIVIIASMVSLLSIFVFQDLIFQRLDGGVRLEIIKSGLSDISRNWLFGGGWSEDDTIIIESGREYSKIHNSYLHVLQVGGIIAFIPFLYLTLFILYKSIKSDNKLIVIVGLWLLYGSLYIAFDGRIPIKRPSEQWLYFWVPLFIIISYNYSQENEKTS